MSSNKELVTIDNVVLGTTLSDWDSRLTQEIPADKIIETKGNPFPSSLNGKISGEALVDHYVAVGTEMYAESKIELGIKAYAEAHAILERSMLAAADEYENWEFWKPVDETEESRCDMMRTMNRNLRESKFTTVMEKAIRKYFTMAIQNESYYEHLQSAIERYAQTSKKIGAFVDARLRSTIPAINKEESDAVKQLRDKMMPIINLTATIYRSSGQEQNAKLLLQRYTLRDAA